MSDLETEFTRFVSEHKSTIYSVCMMFADSPDETEDLVQEALINIWQGFPSVNTLSKSWLYRVTMNSCITIDRKKKRHAKECPLTVDIERIMQSDESNNSNVRMLYDRIHRLNPFDRAIVMLWLEGMPYDEIADIIGISVKNVSVRLFRIKEQLKQMNHGK